VTQKKDRPAANGTGPTHNLSTAKSATHPCNGKTSEPCVSQAVSWWSAHEFVEPVLARVGSWPMVGSVEWCQLPDDDPAKIASIFDAAQHWALRVETAQEQMAEASRAISAAADWGEIAQRNKDLADFRRDHPWAPRRAAS
jgi:hypothetical protein